VIESLKLNERTFQLCERLDHRAGELRVVRVPSASGATVWDFGIRSPSGLGAGKFLATACMANLARVDLTRSPESLWVGPAVQVATDHPVSACLASQYAGWRIAHENFFGMGSGPMRAAAGKEPLFQKLRREEITDRVVGIIETSDIPNEAVVGYIANACQVEPHHVVLLVAPTSSQAGTVQIVARSVETALHKLMELEFDLNRVVSGFGVAPLPPPAPNDITAIGRTNDAILYGADVTLWVRGDDDTVSEITPRIPSSASPDFGRPFRAIFESYDRDFYRIDPHLFSPARIRMCNTQTGNSFAAGELRPDVIAESFLR
jgi:methenyltetrahydromethanopterin cyclohydrolase